MSPSERIPEPVQVVLVTAPDREAAIRIAHTLVAERLAACVNLVPAVHSVYRWQEAIEEGEEVLLLVKTCHSRTAALAERIRALHPYEVPEVLALEASGGSAVYLDWVRDVTAVAEERT